MAWARLHQVVGVQTLGGRLPRSAGEGDTAGDRRRVLHGRRVCSASAVAQASPIDFSRAVLWCRRRLHRREAVARLMPDFHSDACLAVGVGIADGLERQKMMASA